MATRTVAADDPHRQLAEAGERWKSTRSSTDVARVSEAALALVIAARLAGRYREALLVGKEAQSLLEGKAGVGGGLALIESHVCLACLDGGDVVEAARWLEKARRRDVSTNDDAFAALCRAEGNFHLAHQDWADALTSFQRGLSRIKDDIEKSIALYNMGEASLWLEKHDDAREHFVEAFALKQPHNDRWGLAFVHWGLGVCQLAATDAKAALHSAEAGLAHTKSLADPKVATRLATLKARALAELRRHAEAADGARDALRDATRAGLPRERADAQLAVAEIHLLMGQARRAKLAAEEAAKLAEKAGLPTIKRDAERIEAEARGMITKDDG